MTRVRFVVTTALPANTDASPPPQERDDGTSEAARDRSLPDHDAEDVAFMKHHAGV